MASSIEDLPDEVKFDVLSLLSAKQLEAAACVSKSWNRLISEEPSAWRCLASRMAGLYHYGWSDESSYFTEIHGRKSLKHVDTKLGFLPESEFYCVYDTCNGLVLCIDDDGSGWKVSADQYPISYVVCNPATREFTVLPAIRRGDICYCTGLAYDPDRNPGEFKVVRFLFQDVNTLEMEVRVFSPRSKEWKSLRFGLPQLLLLAGRRPVYHKGVLHIPAMPHFMLKFDVEKEVLSLEDLPGEMIGGSLGLLGVTGGVLQYVNNYYVEQGILLVKWVLDEEVEEDKNRWIDADWSVITAEYCKILAIHPDVEVVFMRNRGKIFAYHLKNGREWELCEEKMGDFEVTCPYSPFFVPLGMRS
ncbi:hypothetical protein H6P81_019130 [Aristolochia fimbriata]|uniref:F-box domain-containing protein n=1 Tax=Aristolochia fimbriata TaxID=158543 RepID=A0AAV7DQV8_ARIFI|nr:hypothetical protein H6P81_019130 [Aristolochia fimbriata]